MTLPASSRLAAAAVLAEARASGVPCKPLRHTYPDADVDDAYAIQQLYVLATQPPGTCVVGHKIGLTAQAVRSRFGVDRPDFGVLFSDMAFGDGETVPDHLLMQPKTEVEIAFVLARDLDGVGITAADVVAATDFVVPALELVASRIADWDISIIDTIADNASSGAFVLGNRPRRLTDVDDLATVAARVACEGEVRSTGTGAMCMGHPVNAVVWLANELARRGTPLRRGGVVLSGALGPLVPLEPGREYVGEIDGLGSVHAVIGTTGRAL